MQNSLTHSLLQSSRDPRKVSLTVKGVLLQIVPVVLIFTGNITGFEAVTEDSLNALIDAATQSLALGIELISMLMVTWGMLRKMLPSR